jgi:KH/beta-lactamase-domain protein
MTDFLKELEKEIQELVPEEALITKVNLEGSEVVIYTKNIALFLNSESIVKALASQLKKRIHVRSDTSMLEDPEFAEKKIRELVPEDAGVERISFDKDFNRVVIEAKKLGLVIGKHGGTLKAIAIKTGWMPKLLRVPTAPSPVMDGIRYTLIKHSRERMNILREMGRRIYRQPAKPTEWIRFTPLGSGREVGRSCILLETPESKVLLDCGVNIASRDNPFPLLDTLNFSLDELDAVILSHAHLDHSGFVPYLYKFGFEGPTYCTPPTRDLSVLLQIDYIDVLKKEGQDPPYQEKDIKTMIKHTVTKEYGEVTDISPDIRLTLHNAGHILGSSSTHLHVGHGIHNLLYTSDFKFGYTKLFNTVETRYPRVETLIMESTYGGPRDIQPPRYISDKQLIKTIRLTAQKNGGSVLVPVFGVGRAQEIMLVLEEYASKRGWDIPVYVDGMTKEASAIHTAYPEYLRKSVQRRVLHNNSPFDSEIFLEVDKTRRDEIAEEKGSVVISPSGMLTGGPSVEYFRRMAEDSRNSIVFVGYQGEGTLGRKVQVMGERRRNNNGGNRRIPINDSGRTLELSVNMGIETIEGFSGHSDRNQLLGFYKRLVPKPERVILLHGEESNCLNFSRTLGYKFKIETMVPRNLDSIRLK